MHRCRILLAMWDDTLLTLQQYQNLSKHWSLFSRLMAVYAIRWLSECRECLTDVLVTTLCRKASLTMSFLLTSHFASKWRKTHWTSCLSDLIVATVSAQSRWDEIGLIFSFFAEYSGEVILTGTQPGIGCKYPILKIDREMMAHLAESLMGVTVSLHVLVIGDE